MAAGATGAVAAVHAAPALAGVSPFGIRFTPRIVGRGAPGHVALTFDDGPDPESTPAFLAELDRLGWRATFFMLGTMARRVAGLVGEVAAAGHEVAVHGDEHKNMLRRGPRATADDIRRCRDTLAELTGTAPGVVPPALRDPLVRGAARRATSGAADRAVDHVGSRLAQGGDAARPSPTTSCAGT